MSIATLHKQRLTQFEPPTKAVVAWSLNQHSNRPPWRVPVKSRATWTSILGMACPKWGEIPAPIGWVKTWARYTRG